MISNKLREIFGKDKDTQPTNAEIEEDLEQTTEDGEKIICLYLPYYIRQLERDWMGGIGDLEIPVNKSAEQFTDKENLKEHIKSSKAGEKHQYYFDRKDEEVKETVMEAFREKKCERIKQQKKRAEQTIEEKEQELEELNCE